MLFGVLVGHYISPDQICGSILGDSCASPYNPDSDWNVTLPNTKKPPVVVPKPPKVCLVNLTKKKKKKKKNLRAWLKYK